MKSTMRRKADPVAAGRGSQGRPKNMVFAVIEVEIMDILALLILTLPVKER